MALPDVLQGLNRGFVTGLLGGPVDLANALLGGVGGDEPFLGSRYIGDKLAAAGLLPKSGNAAAEFVGGLLGPGDAFKLAGLAGHAPALAHIMFHGSPHVFDKFDAAKIGTGEGAQAFGRGLYFADAPGVAKDYQKRLTRNAPGDVTLDGKPVATLDNTTPDVAQQHALDLVNINNGDVDAARQDLLNGGYLSAIDWLDRNRARIGYKKPEGALYKVEVPDDAVAKMLDYDKPISAQPALTDPLRRAFDAIYGPAGGRNFDAAQSMTGGDLMQFLSRPDAAESARALSDAGIPGVRYLDAGSRVFGDGTRNTVLFDPKLATIINRNGQPVNRFAEITREFTPGNTTGHLPELLDNPQLQQQYAAMLEPLFTGANGEDKIATALGAQATKTLPNAGYYEGRAAPGFASQVAAKIEGNEIAPSSKALLDAITASHGMLGTQKQSAYNVLTDGVPAAGSPFALQFDAGAPLTGDRMRELQQATHAIDKDVVPMVDPQGARALIFSGTPDERMAQFADVAKQHGAAVTAKAFDGNLFPSVDDYGTPPAKFSMQPYIDKVEAAGPEVVSLWDKHVAPIAAPLLDHVTSFAMQHGLTQAPWFAHAMNAIATKGLAGLKAAVKAGIVPAALLGAIGLSADLPPSPAQNPPA